jgi:hypothetical protein
MIIIPPSQHDRLFIVFILQVKIYISLSGISAQEAFQALQGQGQGIPQG